RASIQPGMSSSSLHSSVYLSSGPRSSCMSHRRSWRGEEQRAGCGRLVPMVTRESGGAPMLRTRSAVIVVALTFAMSGGDRQSGADEAPSPPSHTSKTNASPSGSIPTPDPSVPSATEALSRPRTDSSEMPNSDLTPKERSTEMPMGGQTPGGSSESSVTPSEE